MFAPNQSSLLALAVTFMDIAFVLILLRFVTIRMTKRTLHIDDVCIALAGLFTIAICISMITASAYGVWGLPVPLVTDRTKPPPQALYSVPFQQSFKFTWAQSLLTVFQVTFARLSIVFFYKRTLAPEPFGVLHWATLSVAGVSALWMVSFFFAFLFQCGNHFPVIWQGPALAQISYCHDSNINFTASITGIILDLVIVFLPLHRILTLRLSPSKKLQVAGAFSVGLLSVVGGTVRLVALIPVVFGIHTGFEGLQANMLASTMAFWQVFEVGFAMIAASLPGLRPLINRVAGVVDSTFSSIAQRSSKEKSSRCDSDAASFSSTSKIVKMTINKGQISRV